VIKLHALLIEEFRGIRKLRLDFAGKNFAVYGPNGTGKSGVVDAIEFVLTGNITRLTGQGTSNISLKTHAPHVDQRNAPERARVILQAYVPSLKKKVTIERRVSNPNAPTVTPDEPEVRQIVAELALHPEFALTRREIIKYVLAAPGERSKEVQALLRLEEIERVRQSLQTIHNSSKADFKRAEQEANQAQLQLLRALGMSVLRRDELLKVVNQRRELLGLEALTDLVANTSLKSGLGGTAATEGKLPVPKKQALTDVNSLATRLVVSENPELVSVRDATKAILRKLTSSPSLLKSLRTEQFLRSGLELVEEDQCPFCDREWNLDDLKQHVQRKLAQAKEAFELKQELVKSAQPLVAELLDLATVASTATAYGKALPEPLAMEAVTRWIDLLRNKRETVASSSNIERSSDIVETVMHEHSVEVKQELDELQKRINMLPDASQEDEAKEFLTVAQERLDVYREAKRQQDKGNKQFELSAKVLSAFSDSANRVLTGIYNDVQQDFSNFYQFINREDETTFSGKLIPSFGKLGFDVDFYGRGFFPPGAYHSEGHQDSMGICLYLALMRHTLGKQFTFAVLDDVLMSVDSGHRREVCSLLKSQFPDTQFIVTTHDEIWLNHMKTEQLITSKSSVQFRKWTVDDGPHVWEGGEIWQEIQDDLDQSDVPAAAQTLRRYLEYITAQLSSKLRASIEYRADAQHDLGELLPAVLGMWSKLLSRAQEVAQSWGNKDEMARLSQRQGDFGQRVEKTNVERWSINKSIHYNEWASLQKQDFIPVVTAFRELLEMFRCPACRSFIYVIPSRGDVEGLRCDCGSVNINLKKRPKQPPPS
jgi:recombinational DNA repair ATPase RecF